MSRRCELVGGPLLALGAWTSLLLSAFAPAQEAARRESQEPVALGAPAAFGTESIERIRVAAGAVLRSRPDARSAVLVTIDVETELDVLGREGDWVEVRHGAWRGWVAFDPELASAVLGGLLERPLEGPQPERLARARRLLGAPVDEREVAGYRLLSDVDSEPLLEDVRAALDHVDAAYRSWFGLDPGPPAGEVVIVYAEEEAYRAFRSGESSLGDLDPAGVAGGGLAVVHAEERVTEELTSIVVHELVHLLNRRALAHELPVWLEEGLASALAWARLDATGKPLPGTFWQVSTVHEELSVIAGSRRRTTATLMRGPRVDLARLLRRRGAGELVSLGELVEMPASRFLVGPALDDHYGLSAALVRYLLDGDEGRWREAFLGLLAEGPRPELTGSEQLAARLGTDLEALEARLWRWVRRQVPPGLERIDGTQPPPRAPAGNAE